MQHNSDGIVGGTISYVTVALGYSVDYLRELDWMAVGAGVLLVIRIVQDLPRAIQSVQDWRTKKRKPNNDKSSE